MINGLNNATSHTLNQALLQNESREAKAHLDGLQKTFSNSDADHKKLIKAAQDFEAIFLQQLLDAMDKTVMKEEDSLIGGSEAEKSFRGMLNQNISTSIATAPGGSGLGLAETIYRQASLTMNQKKINEVMEQQQQLQQPAGDAKRVDAAG